MAALAAAMGTSVSASAHEFRCEQAVNGEVVHRIDHYPATLDIDVLVTNTHPTDASVALRVEDALMAKAGVKVAPFTLQVGESVHEKFELKVHDKAECEALVGGNVCSAEGDAVFRIIHDAGETQCGVEIVCGEEGSGGGSGGNGGGSCDDGKDHDFDDCACEPGMGKKHGLGFWKVHEDALAACVAGGPVDLGIATVTTMADFEGILWGSPAKFGDGAKRDHLDQQRFILARELLVATCNVRVLGAEWAYASEVSDALSVLRGTSCVDIQKFNLPLKLDRDCDGKHVIVKGPATPQDARRMAVDPTRPSGQDCTDIGGGKK